jgi:hypothetical protein
VLVVAALALGCAMGAVAGGAAGLMVGRMKAQRAAPWGLGQPEGRWPMEGCPWGGGQVLPTPGPDFRQELPPSGVEPDTIVGVLVVQVVPGAPAEAAGLMAGDVITGVDAVPIDANHSLPDVISQFKPGDRVTLHWTRDGKQQAAEVKLGVHPEDPARAYLGVTVRTMSLPGIEMLPEFRD